MANFVECIIEANEVVVKVALVLYVFCYYDCTLPLTICSTVLCPAYNLASPSLGGWSTLLPCSPGIV